MSKKDILERISQVDGGAPRPGDAAARPAGEEFTTTRVSKKVVRRRVRKTSGSGDDADKAVIRRRVVEETPETAPVEAAPAPAAEEPAPASAAEPTPPAAEPAPPAAEPEAPAPAVEAPPAEPAAAEPVAAAPEAPAAAEPAAVEPAAEPAAPAAASGRAYKGLGSAVIAPPPGYDPSNPEAFRERQKREQAGTPAAGDDRGQGRGRRRVADATSTTATPRDAGGGGAARRGRRRGRGREMTDAMGIPLRPRRRKKRSSGPKAASPQPKAQKRKVRVDGVISVAQLAHALSIKAPMVIKKLMEMGSLHTVNDMLDVDTATLVAAEFDYEVENVAFDESAFLNHVDVETEDDSANAVARPPVVTIMGHVDHGKTTLLDTIRESRVAAGEAGGITQHIGAYQVERNGHKITFLDTPGHAAFSAMRARGAEITDLVILVVAADDGVQPQTVEAIHHAKAAGVPLIVAVNKIDKPGVNPEKIRNELGAHELIPEDWGGETMFVDVSALRGDGIDELLEAIVLQSEVLELRANPERPAEGFVIEAKVERGRGPVASVLVQQGTLHQGDHVVLGTTFGKVRAMMDHRGKNIDAAGPSQPVEIFGLSHLPGTGDVLQVTKTEKNARTLAEHRADEAKKAESAKSRRRTLEDLQLLAEAEERKVLFVVLKADVQGSLEALKAAILNLDVGGSEVRFLHDGVGNISESDVHLVASNDGLLIGFNVRVDARARRTADEIGVSPELYTVIYDVIDRVEGSLKGMLDPVYEEERRGTAEVRAVFHISKIGTVAGCYIMEGNVGRNHGARVFRNGEELWKGDVKTLRRFKDDVKQVATGYECGIAMDGFNDIQQGDVIETFEMVRVDPT